MKKILVVMFLMIFVGGCSSLKSTEKTANSLAEIEYNINYGFYAKGMQILQTNPETKISFIFPSIQGAIFGNPSDDLIYMTTIDRGFNFTLRLPQDMSDRAYILRDDRLVITPDDTKLMRLGTFHKNLSAEGDVGGGGFVDKKSGDYVVLVYFSKPSSVKGVVESRGVRYEHDIFVSKSGWNWIGISKKSETLFVLSQFRGSLDDIEFSIMTNNSLI